MIDPSADRAWFRRANNLDLRIVTSDQEELVDEDGRSTINGTKEGECQIPTMKAEVVEIT